MADIPDDVRRMIAGRADADEQPSSLISAISVQIATKRDEAKSARAASGIEAIWTECEEAYNGIDDANRGEFIASGWSKPTSINAPLTTDNKVRKTDHRSTVYLRLTSRYVDAGTAKLSEILLSADDKAFSFKGTPVPDLVEALENESQVVQGDMGVPLTRPATPSDAQPVAPIQAPPMATPPPGAQMDPAAMLAAPAPAAAPARVPLTVRDLATEKIEIASKRAKAAEARIYDWMVETQYRAEIRKVISDSARLGVGVLKAPTPKSKRVMAVTKTEAGVDLVMKEKIIPSAAWVDPWNVFPDPSCGENIADGDYVFERDYMSARQVRGLKKLPGYIASQIDQVLDEGPDKANMDGDGGKQGGVKSKGRFTVWFFYGVLTKDEMAAIDRASGKDSTEDGPDEAHAIVTLINDSVVRATLNPLDSGSFPYHSMPWQRRSGHWAGVGVAEQMRAPQKITNAALRALLNNAGKSAGSQIVVNQQAIVPADGSWTITPDKIWWTTADAPADVRLAFMAVAIPNVTQQMMEIVNLGERFAEETTSIPLITQGMSGSTTPNTFGAAQLQNNNANQLLRAIGYSFDDCITEPVIRQYYEWLLLDPDVPNDEKGDFEIDAHGSSALVERAIQDQSIAQMAAMVLNPAYGLDPKKWATLFLKSKHLSAGAVEYSDEDRAKMEAAPPAEAPAVAVAKIASETQLKLGVMQQTADQRTAQAEGQIAAAAHVLQVGVAQTTQQRMHGDLTLKAEEAKMSHERALLEYASREKISLEDAKVQLAKVSMQLQAQRDLNQADREVDLQLNRDSNPSGGVAPPVQVPGRAADGKAFEQIGA